MKENILVTTTVRHCPSCKTRLFHKEKTCPKCGADVSTVKGRKYTG